MFPEDKAPTLTSLKAAISSGAASFIVHQPRLLGPLPCYAMLGTSTTHEIVRVEGKNQDDSFAITRAHLGSTAASWVIETPVTVLTVTELVNLLSRVALPYSTATLTNKTLTSPVLGSPVLTTPQINDTTADHQYVFAVSELAADRTVTLPLLGAADEFVFAAHAATLTNKTLTSPVLTTPQINDTTADHQYVFAVSELAADRTVTLPLLTEADTFVFAAHAQTLTNKTLTSPTLSAPAFTSSPTGDGITQWAEVSLTSAQVKSLTTLATLVAAPGAGKMLEFISAQFFLDYGGTNVFTETADNLVIIYAGLASPTLSGTIEMTGFIDQSADTFTRAESLPTSNNTIIAKASVENKAIVLFNPNDEIGGNAANDNVLRVKVAYRVWSTGW